MLYIVEIVEHVHYSFHRQPFVILIVPSLNWHSQTVNDMSLFLYFAYPNPHLSLIDHYL